MGKPAPVSRAFAQRRAACPSVWQASREWLCIYFLIWLVSWASLVAQTVTSLPEVQETLVQSLAWEDPLEKGMAIHSSILAWRTP